MSSLDDYVWFLIEEEMSDSGENEEENDDDSTGFHKKCLKCGSALVWREDKRKWVCPTCKSIRR